MPLNAIACLLYTSCAAALAFVVLYNLTNINIAERVREIATFKVLGFYSLSLIHIYLVVYLHILSVVVL